MGRVGNPCAAFYMKGSMTVRSLFSQSRRWTKNRYRQGSGSTKCYCLLGALAHVYLTGKKGDQSRWERAKARVTKAIIEILGGASRFNGIAAFNDSPRTTFEDIQQVVRKARV